ncbi:hypothetical protein Q8A73_018683 [Channa argus]|nr:hypothetical protein Q8A73_018683 [Channa argus]
MAMASTSRAFSFSTSYAKCVSPVPLGETECREGLGKDYKSILPNNSESLLSHSPLLASSGGGALKFCCVPDECSFFQAYFPRASTHCVIAITPRSCHGDSVYCMGVTPSENEKYQQIQSNLSEDWWMSLLVSEQSALTGSERCLIEHKVWCHPVNVKPFCPAAGVPTMQLSRNLSTLH